MKKQINIQPNFAFLNLIKSKFRDHKNDNFRLYKSGRYSLYFGLIKIMKNNPQIKNIYVPTFICPQVLMPLDKLNLNVNFYQVNENLSLDKEYLNKTINSESIIIVINYFGFPSDWEYFEELREKTKCVLISDNCHSLLSKYKGKNLSQYGDLSFNSFRKIIPVMSGSQLFYNTIEYNDKQSKTRFPNLGEILYMFRSLKPSFIKTRLGDTKLVGEYNPLKDNKYFFNPKADNTIDILSDSLFNNYIDNHQELTNKRQQNYQAWLNYLPKSEFIFFNNLKLDEEITPYAFPCIAKSKNVMNKWILWGRENNISIINWANKNDNLNHHLKLILLFPIVPDRDIKLTLSNYD